MRRSLINLLCLVSLGCLAPVAQAWENHALISQPALERMPELAQAAPAPVEKLETFVSRELVGLSALLKEEEAWARAKVPGYKPLPAALELTPTPGGDVRQRFLEAVRMNPGAKLALFRMLPPAEPAAGRPVLPWEQVTTLKDPGNQAINVYLALTEGELVRPVDILSGASDEPDYGLDIGLFDDNGTEYGKRYGLGPQPFGNPALEFSSQSPFHMGFYHEAPIVYKAAGFLKETWPEVRLHQCLSLARYAFRTGHPYWGWRFAGWGLHYAQDLSQPYHARVLPGVSTARMLGVNALSMLGIKKPRDKAVTLVSNRHLALEDYVYERLVEELGSSGAKQELVPLIQEGPDSVSLGTYGDVYPREHLTARAAEQGDKTDQILEKAMPARYISDPTYVYGETEPSVPILKMLEAQPEEALWALDSLTKGLMTTAGGETRVYLRGILAP